MNKSLLIKKVLRGFNTWDSTSVLSHVLMPYGFSVRIGFKDYATDSNNVSILRNVLIGDEYKGKEILTPGLRSYDGTYTELKVDFVGVSASVKTAAKDNDLFVLIEPLKHCEAPVSVFVEGGILWNREGTVRRKADCIEGEFEDTTICIYTTGEEKDDPYLNATSAYINVALTGKVLFSTKRISLQEGEQIIAVAKEKTLSSLEKYGKLKECYKGLMSVLSWETVYEPKNDRVFSTVSRQWSKSAGGYVMFCWDMFFTALMFSEEHKEFSYLNVLSILDEATNRGFVPNFSCANDYKSYDRSQPPVGSLVVRKIYDKFKEKWFIEEVFEKLYRWNTWFYQNRMEEDGMMCWGSDNEWPQDLKYFKPDIYNRLGAALESGLDNSPMYDDIPFNKETSRLCLADVGLMGLYICDCENLAYLAKELGKTAEKVELEHRMERVDNALQTLWNEDIGLYLNKRTDTGLFEYRLSPTHFYALYSNKITERQKQEILKHYFNEDEFYGEYVLPSIARNDPAYKDQFYWRGCIWAPMNYLVYEAFKKQNAVCELKDLVGRSTALFLKEWNLCRHIHENYNCDTGMGCGLAISGKFYNWGALLAFIAIKEGEEYFNE